MKTAAQGLPEGLFRGRLPSLDGLRALAVLLVLFAHAHQTHNFPDVPALHVLGNLGSVGVDVFFVISGFLITNLMLREVQSSGHLDIKQFYIRRVLRIIPAYAALLIVVALLASSGNATLSSRDWVAASTYTVNFVHKPAWEIGHAWSLSIEEHFYLAWPLVFALSPWFLGVRAALGCMILCPLARWVVMLLNPSLTPMTELWTFTRLDTIATGCLLAYLTWDARWRERLDRLVYRNWCVALTAIVLVGCLALSTLSAKFSVGISYSVNAVCIGILIWAAVRRHRTVVGRALNSNLAQIVGVASYSIYLWQQLFLHPGQSSVWCSFPQNIVFVFLAAYLSYTLIEKPVLALRKKLQKGDALPESSAVRPQSGLVLAGSGA